MLTQAAAFRKAETRLFCCQIPNSTNTLTRNFHSPVCVLIINDQQDLGLAYDRFWWLTAPCRSSLGGCCCCCRFGVRSGSHVLGHLSTLHHTGEGAEEAPWGRSGAWGRAWARARPRGLTLDARGLPPLCGRGGRRGSGWSWRGRPLQIHHVAVGEVGHEAAVWQAPAEVVHGDGLVGQSGQRRWGERMPEELQRRKRKWEGLSAKSDLSHPKIQF